MPTIQLIVQAIQLIVSLQRGNMTIPAESAGAAPAPDDQALLAPDPRIAYQRALTAFVAMSEELLAASLDLIPESAPNDKRDRYALARRGLTSALALLNDAQYRRLSKIVVNEQQTFSRQLDLLADLIKELQTDGKAREIKIDRLLAAIDPLPSADYPKGS